ncbi:MAG TPA: ABC transporter permease [Blastocatellia bacterium]|nr:ABC transporter permease [Blastocatellia bacterium]
MSVKTMNTLLQDLRYGARMLLKQPGFTAVAVITLALGIGANSAIFSVINAVLIKPLPYREPDRLVQFWETNPLKNWTHNVVAPANLFDWQKQNQVFEEIAAYYGSDKKGPGLSGFQMESNGEPERVKALYVTGNVFSALGANAMIGRALREEETWEGKHTVAVLSYGLWRRRFGADPKIVGQKIMFNGRSREVVGVMPPDFYFPSKEAEMWIPMGWNYAEIAKLRRPHFLRAVGRLKPGVTLERARAEMKAIASRLEQQYPDTNTQMGAGLMIRSFGQLQQVDPGFDPNNALSLSASLPESKYPEETQQRAFFEQAERRIRRLPGVIAVGSTTVPALKGFGWTSDATIEGRPPEDYPREIRHKVITPDYFSAMGVTLLKGRFFNESDNDKSQPVIIVNATLARRHFPNEDPIGKRLKFSKPTAQGPWRTIIGVVNDEKQDGLGAKVEHETYQSHMQNAQSDMTFIVRSATDPQSLVGAVREEIRALDRSLPLYDIKTMRVVIYESVARERFITLLLIVFAALALTLASVGIYGVMSYSVTQRTHEIGVRMALGARSRDVLKLVVAQGGKLASFGVAIGLISAFALTRLMKSLLFGVTATDPVTFIAVAMLLTVVALLACYIPARRASKVDPMAALRYE